MLVIEGGRRTGKSFAVTFALGFNVQETYRIFDVADLRESVRK